jgi:hypothetical protein
VPAPSPYSIVIPIRISVNGVDHGVPDSLRPLAVGVGSRCGPGALIPPAGVHNATVNNLQREDQQVDPPCLGDRSFSAEEGDGHRGKPDGHVEQVTLDLLARHRQLVCAEIEGIAPSVGPQVHQHEHKLDGDESGSVDEHQERNLGRLYFLVLGKAEQLVHPQGNRPRGQREALPPTLRQIAAYITV